MSSSPPADQSGSQRVVSFVLQSKKALQHGEQLCTQAHTLSSTSAQTAIDVLALDAQVRWISEAVLDQLKLAAQVAKSIEQKRSELEQQVEAWDTLRNKRTDALDAILESLGTQVVQPDFHSTSGDSSPFGSQHFSDDDGDETTPVADGQPGRSPTDTIRHASPRPKRADEGKQQDRKRWKTLRDFVDERAIEDLLDTVDRDRVDVEDILDRTSDYPESLSRTIGTIRDTVPTELAVPSLTDIFDSQESVSVKMANQLESLVTHYGQMSNALEEVEAGEEFHEDDIQAMSRDTDELPVIISELEEGLRSIESSHEQLLSAKESAQSHLEVHKRTLNDLEELGSIMSDMLDHQQAVENENREHLELLHHHLGTIEDLHHRYTNYQYSYNKLVLELARRRQYREAAQKIVDGMTAQLEAMSEEERQVREEFNSEHGQFLPEDVCLCIQNPPTRWTVTPWNNEPLEVLPTIEPDLLEEAYQRTVGLINGGGLGTSQSL